MVFTAVATGYGFTCATGGVQSSSPPVAMDPPVIVDMDENSTYLLVTFDEPDFKAGRTVVMYYLNCTNTVNGTSHTGAHTTCAGVGSGSTDMSGSMAGI